MKRIRKARKPKQPPNEIKKYSFKKELRVEFEIVPIHQRFEYFKDLLTSPHRTSFYQLIWFKKGTLTHWVDFTPIKITSSTMLVLNKDMVQYFDKQNKFECYSLLFTDTFFNRSESDLHFLRNSILFNDVLDVTSIQLDDANKDIEIVFGLMIKESSNLQANTTADLLKHYLHSLLLLLEREKRRQGFKVIKKGPNLDYMMKFIEFLDKDYKNNKLVNYYADQIGISEKRLSKATSALLGKSPKQIIDDRIILEAKRLLVHTNKSVKEIAFMLGFEEPTNFIKYIRKHTKMTPVEFRESFLSQ